MTRNEIVVLSNDVVPGMGLPVAAPGLRAWGIARGLRAHGHDVTIAVDRNVVKRARTGYLPPTRPSGTMLVGPRQVGDMIRLRGTRALVMTNSNHIERIGDLGQTRLVYDFFAPKMLELSLQATPESREEQMEILRLRKIDALRKSSAVIINGAKKVPYVHDWLERAGNPVPLDHTGVVNMPLPPQVSLAPEDGPVHAIVAGYIQPWSMPGEWAEVVRPFLEEGSLVLHLLVVNHWGSHKARTSEVPENFARLFGLPNVVRHGPMEFDDFRRLLAQCHLSIDLFERNPERELAMVTRTAVSLSCGLPVLHVPFTETSEFVRDHGAGWLVESEDLDGIRNALKEAVSDPGILAARRAGAQEVAREVLEPATATEPLHRILEDLW